LLLCILWFILRQNIFNRKTKAVTRVSIKAVSLITAFIDSLPGLKRLKSGHFTAKFSLLFISLYYYFLV